MFKNYIKESLSLSDFNQIMKTAPDGQAYCNAFCQKNLKVVDFYDNKASCKECYNFMIKIKKMVDAGQLTYEQFKSNNELIKRDKVTISIYRNCITCVTELSLDKFEATRKECIECRKKKKKINYEEQFEIYKISIEEVKTDITVLSRLLKAMSSDLLKLVVKEYKITMSHSDRKKDIMIVKILDYFTSLLSPFICLGKCGATLTVEFTVCYQCKIKPKTSAEEIMMEFEKNLDTLVEGLESMKKEDSIQYNKKQIIMIAKKLDIKFNQNQDKFVIADIIDKHFQTKKEDEQKSILKNLGGEISLNGIIILARPEDGYINATALCKAGGKQFKYWHSLELTKELFSVLSSVVGIPTTELIIIKQGSWIHPDLSVPLAQWISAEITIKVSRWMRELALTCTVTLGFEKTQQQLLELQTNYKKLEDKHRKSLQKKQYHKFKKGSAFYIISDLDGKSLKFKPGFDGEDVFVRLQQHRSSLPVCKVEYLIYSNDAKLIETAVLKKFESKRKIINHEWIYDVDINFIIKSTKAILDVLNIEYTEDENIEDYNKQIILDYE